MNASLETIQALLASHPPGEDFWSEVLRVVLPQFQSETGTIHRLETQTQLLHLVAQTGLPPHLLPHVQTIPVGKGIAGETVQKNRPVTICNLQTDTSGVARPGAKQTGVGGALCVPVRVGDYIAGTLGIGTVREHEYSAAEINAMLDLARLIGPRLSQAA